MKVRIFLLPLAATLLLAACAEKPQPEAPPLAVLVRPAGAGSALDVALYTGDVRARHEAELGFRVAGKLAARLVDSGARVTRGRPWHGSIRPTCASPPRRRGPIWLRPKPI